jgi:hypothetical protein
MLGKLWHRIHKSGDFDDTRDVVERSRHGADPFPEPMSLGLSLGLGYGLGLG